MYILGRYIFLHFFLCGIFENHSPAGKDENSNVYRDGLREFFAVLSG